MSSYVLILTEGEKEEVYAIHSLNDIFLKGENMHIISFKTNIYSLYSQLKKDDFETDIIEVLKEKNAGKDILCGEISIAEIDREDISEIYLLFDYDAHHYDWNVARSISELTELVQHFDNETEQGKLYLSYPMVEAINYHYVNRSESMPVCYFPYHSGSNAEGKHFKRIQNEAVQFMKKLKKDGFTEDEWLEIFRQFLYVIHHAINDGTYENVNPINVFHAQLQLIENEQKIVVLSGIPALIIEYFGRKFYDNIVSEAALSAPHERINL